MNHHHLSLNIGLITQDIIFPHDLFNTLGLLPFYMLFHLPLTVDISAYKTSLFCKSLRISQQI